jgi:uncharacterized 2Fe-2S/4Fe-4S cluster protein (DUF4445 family)
VLLQPIGVTLHAADGAPLRDLLFDQGVEFPCGGNGRCRGCRCRVIEGEFAVNDAQRERLSPEELDAGWRLSCQCRVHGDAVIELRQWDVAVLADDSVFAFTPGEGLGVAVDLGTTTLVAQLVDLATGNVLGVRTALNPQARHGGDVMSRVQFAVMQSGQPHLQHLIRAEIGKLISQLLKTASVSDVRRVTIVGNTVMHHLFSGVSVEPMSHTPFESADPGPREFSASELGWSVGGDPRVLFLPCLGGFVGSDILAGILATRLHESPALVALVDLGTNGEIVLGNRDRMLFTSTAAGPAFEGARIHSGMRAATGAIWKVTRDGADGFHCEVLGGGEPHGLCGSGLVDAAATALEMGRILPTGRLADRTMEMALAGPVTLTQTDIRELQLAKGAIAAGIRLLLNKWGAGPEDVATVHLAGAFGNYISRASAKRIGLLYFPSETVIPAGNTALLGAKMALFLPDEGLALWRELEQRMEHVSLNLEPDFQDVYAEEMGFPKG